MALLSSLALAAFLCGSGESGVESGVLEPPGWAWEVRPYLWLPALDVTATIGSTTVSEARKNHRDLFDDVEPAWMLGLDAAPDDGVWGLIFDLSYLDISTKRGSRVARVEQTLLEVDAFFRAPDLPRTDFFVGLRYIELDTRATNAGVSASDNASLVDPVVGARTVIPLSEKWAARLRADIGGFGLGTDLTWHGAFGFAYRMKNGGEIDLAYRLLEIDYADDYELDARFSGPMFGLIWGF